MALDPGKGCLDLLKESEDRLACQVFSSVFQVTGEVLQAQGTNIASTGFERMHGTRDGFPVPLLFPSTRADQSLRRALQKQGHHLLDQALTPHTPQSGKRRIIKVWFVVHHGSLYQKRSILEMLASLIRYDGAGASSTVRTARSKALGTIGLSNNMVVESERLS
jgi:hypothetical protein